MLDNDLGNGVDRLGLDGYFMGYNTQTGQMAPGIIDPSSYIAPRVDLSFLPEDIGDEQRGLWREFQIGVPAEADYRKLLEFSKSHPLRCYCAPISPGEVTLSGENSIFSSESSFLLEKPWQYTVWLGAVTTAIQYSDSSSMGPYSTPDAGFGIGLDYEETKREFRKRNRRVFDSGGHKEAWARRELQLTSNKLARIARANNSKTNDRADALGMATNISSNFVDASFFAAQVRVVYSKNEKCWYALSYDPRNRSAIGGRPDRPRPIVPVRLERVEANNLIKTFFEFSGLPNPIGVK